MDLNLSTPGDTWGDPIPGSYTLFKLEGSQIGDTATVTGIRATLEDRVTDPKILFITSVKSSNKAFYHRWSLSNGNDGYVD